MNGQNQLVIGTFQLFSKRYSSIIFRMPYFLETSSYLRPKALSLQPPRLFVKRARSTGYRAFHQ